MIGQAFGKLVVVEQGTLYVSPKGWKQRRWICSCECGNSVEVLQNDLKKKYTISCSRCKLFLVTKVAERYVSGYRTDECILAIGKVNADGYGLIRHGGKKYTMHVFVLRLIGRKVPPGMITRHKCKKKSCFNPDHLEFGTDKDNAIDMFRDGTLATKLTELNVIEIIKRRACGETCDSIAKTMGVTFSSVSRISRGEQWKHVHAAIDLIGLESVSERLEHGDTCYAIGRELGFVR